MYVQTLYVQILTSAGLEYILLVEYDKITTYTCSGQIKLGSLMTASHLFIRWSGIPWSPCIIASEVFHLSNDDPKRCSTINIQIAITYF